MSQERRVINCPHCSQAMAYPSGREITLRCPRCFQQFTVLPGGAIRPYDGQWWEDFHKWAEFHIGNERTGNEFVLRPRTAKSSDRDSLTLVLRPSEAIVRGSDGTCVYQLPTSGAVFTFVSYMPAGHPPPTVPDVLWYGKPGRLGRRISRIRKWKWVQNRAPVVWGVPAFLVPWKPLGPKRLEPECEFESYDTEEAEFGRQYGQLLSWYSELYEEVEITIELGEMCFAATRSWGAALDLVSWLVFVNLRLGAGSIFRVRVDDRLMVRESDINLLHARGMGPPEWLRMYNLVERIPSFHTDLAERIAERSSTVPKRRELEVTGKHYLVAPITMPAIAKPVEMSHDEIDSALVRGKIGATWLFRTSTDSQGDWAPVLQIAQGPFYADCGVPTRPPPKRIIAGSGNWRQFTWMSRDEAEERADQDRKRNEADSAIYRSETLLKDNANKVSGADKSKMESSINEVKEATKGGDASDIRSATERLNGAWQSISAELRRAADESTILRCAPAHEAQNLRVKELFGWRLERRRKAKGCVDLHLVRPLTLPNLDRIRQAEACYDRFVSSELPATRSLRWPILFGITLELAPLAEYFLGEKIRHDLPNLSALLIWTFVVVTTFGVWIAKRIKKRSGIALRLEKLLQDAATLREASRLSGSGTRARPREGRKADQECGASDSAVGAESD